MKRTPLKRKTPLKRGPMRRATRKSKYKARPRDTAYMLWVKRQPCAARNLAEFMEVTGFVLEASGGTVCQGPVQADHAGRRGVGRKADDRTCIPLCEQHHRQRQDFHGPFKKWTQRTMRRWIEQQIANTQAAYAYAEWAKWNS